MLDGFHSHGECHRQKWFDLATRVRYITFTLDCLLTYRQHETNSYIVLYQNLIS